MSRLESLCITSMESTILGMCVAGKSGYQAFYEMSADFSIFVYNIVLLNMISDTLFH